MSVRASSRVLEQQAKEKEIWILAYWEDENSVSVLKTSDVKASPSLTPGSECVVTFKGKEYTGQIAATGSKEEMVLNMNNFFKGTYTPFEDCSTTHDENTDLYVKRYEEKYNVYDELYVRWLIKNHPDDVRSDWMKELQDSEKASNNKKKKRKLVNEEDSTDGDTTEQPDEANEPKTKKSRGKESMAAKQKEEKQKTANKKEKEPANKKKKNPAAAKQSKQKAKGSILTTGSGGGIADESDLESEGVSNNITDSDTEDNTNKKGKSNSSGLGSNDKDSSKVTQDRQLASVLKRVTKLEKENESIRNELFEMETRLLKALSDNKAYVIRKAKEFKVLHEKPYHPEGTEPQNRNEITRQPPINLTPDMQQQQQQQQQQQNISEARRHPLINLTPDTQQQQQQNISEARRHLLPLNRNNDLPSTSYSQEETFYGYDDSFNDSFNNPYGDSPYSLPEQSGYQMFRESPYYQNQYDSTYGQPQQFIPTHPDQVVEKYKQWKTPSGMSRLSVKLARESYFGENVLGMCTPQGRSEQDKLPREPLLDLKLYLVRLFPTLNNAEFEGYWKVCLTSIGQACKSIRKNKNK